MLKWSSCWVTANRDGPHIDGRRDGVWIARVVACRRLASMPVLCHPCGRTRRLYLAMVYRDGDWQIAGVYGSDGAARRACATALGEVTS
ncbi:MAG: hypothetical protein IT438_15925 [Phycisphaerales bacterium]|nr:hypothetical protein [Phycisphaerales bacterium]